MLAQTESFNWSILVIILFAGVVALPVLLSVFFRRATSHKKVTRTGWTTAGLVAGGAVGLVVMLQLLRQHESIDPQPAPLESVLRPAVHMEPPPIVASTTADSQSDGEVWRDVVEEEFETDIYPSATVAARALAHQIVPMVPFRVLPKDVSPTRFTIVPDSGLPQESDFSIELASVLENRFTVPAKIGAAAARPSPISGHVIVTLTCPQKTTQASAPWSTDQPEITGSLKATVLGEAGEVAVMTKFIDKPWVAQFDQFVSTNPERNLLLSRSHRFAASTEAAFVLAEERGADGIAQMLMPLVRQSGVQLIPDIEIQTRNTVRWLINSGVFVQDRFVQRLSRPYGDVYRAAILLEVKPDQLETLKGEIYTISRSRQREQHASVSFIGGAVVIFGVVTLLCLFLNHATRGYYRARLSAVCLCGGAVLIGGAAFWLTVARSEVDLRTRLTVQDLTRQNAVPTKPRSPAVSVPARPVPTPPKVQVHAPQLEKAEDSDGGKIDPLPENPRLESGVPESNPNLQTGEPE